MTEETKSRRQELAELVRQRQAEFDEAEGAMPYHSARPWQYERLEQAEEALAEAKRLLAELEQGA